MSHDHSINSTDYYAYTSKLSALNPMYKLITSLIILIICILADNIIVSLTIIFSMSFLITYIGGLSIHKYVSFLSIPVTFVILSSFIISIGISKSFMGEYCLNIYFCYLYSSNIMIIKALNLALKAIGAISAMYMLTLSTPIHEIISVLRKLHIPKILIELMFMIYRFIFVLIDTWKKLRISAQSRLGYIDFKTSCKTFGITASTLLILSMKKANTYYDSLISRCYNGELIFLEQKKILCLKHVVYAFLYILFLIILHIFTKFML